MTYAWIITEGHESDIVGILDEGYSDDLLAVRRPARSARNRPERRRRSRTRDARAVR